LYVWVMYTSTEMAEKSFLQFNKDNIFLSEEKLILITVINLQQNN